jgi:hypothetical protein
MHRTTDLNMESDIKSFPVSLNYIPNLCQCYCHWFTLTNTHTLAGSVIGIVRRGI